MKITISRDKNAMGMVDFWLGEPVQHKAGYTAGKREAEYIGSIPVRKEFFLNPGEKKSFDLVHIKRKKKRKVPSHELNISG